MFNPISLLLRRRPRPTRPPSAGWAALLGGSLMLAASLAMAAPASHTPAKSAKPAASKPAASKSRQAAPARSAGRAKPAQATRGTSARGRPAPGKKGRSVARRAAPAAAGAAALSAAPGEMPRFAAPAPGAVLQAFDGEQNKGVDIAGHAGDPVAVAADGKVAFVGTELAGYGRTVIVEHGGQVISAYAHVRNIRVREQQMVRQGEVIAEIDDGDAGEESRLHFEIRRQGVAVDPQLYMSR
ncbi:peptidase M23-like protein [Pseudacidovorax intermedius]|uniref:Peptidase M23-like protein n=1 Tax=Pseudacidovorax intermedius TaxID=433924 RepID=A0A370FC74_9BURK|nr:M23 family metallopeptidase [Pseudacidovorax intermedius]RDI22047.1 peptidase M23-like protein [Pseudacidovorax intermedius]